MSDTEAQAIAATVVIAAFSFGIWQKNIAAGVFALAFQLAIVMMLMSSKEP